MVRIKEWQEASRRCLQVWTIQDPDGLCCSVYESFEAASLELEWHKARGPCGVGFRIVQEPVITLELSEVRWVRWGQP